MAAGFVLPMARRCWAQFPRVYKASSVYLARNLVWAMFKTIQSVNIWVWGRWALVLTDPGLWPHSRLAVGAGCWLGCLSSAQSSRRLDWTSLYVNRLFWNAWVLIAPIYIIFLSVSLAKAGHTARPASMWKGTAEKQGPLEGQLIWDRYRNNLSHHLSHKEGFFYGVLFSVYWKYIYMFRLDRNEEVTLSDKQSSPHSRSWPKDLHTGGPLGKKLREAQVRV